MASGCQMFHSNSARLQAGLRIPQQAAPHTYAQQQLELGRAALATQNYASAAAAFRNSALEPEFAAESHNGLAIAYAGMGRNDLAEDYFRQAIAEDPATPKYADNLLRLQRANFAIEQDRRARAELIAIPAAPQSAQVMPGTSLRASLTITAPTNQMRAAGGTAIHIGAYYPPHTKPAQRVSSARAKRDPLPTIATRESTSLPADPVAAVAGPQSPAVARSGTERRTVSLTMPRQPKRPLADGAPRLERRSASSPIQTTGRRYTDQQFAEVFAPYSGIAERTPIMGSVSSPGLRSNAAPRSVLAQAPSESSSLAVAGQ